MGFIKKMMYGVLVASVMMGIFTFFAFADETTTAVTDATTITEPTSETTIETTTAPDYNQTTTTGKGSIITGTSVKNTTAKKTATSDNGGTSYHTTRKPVTYYNNGQAYDDPTTTDANAPTTTAKNKPRISSNMNKYMWICIILIILSILGLIIFNVLMSKKKPKTVNDNEIYSNSDAKRKPNRKNRIK